MLVSALRALDQLLINFPVSHARCYTCRPETKRLSIPDGSPSRHGWICPSTERNSTFSTHRHFKPYISSLVHSPARHKPMREQFEVLIIGSGLAGLTVA